MTGSALVSRDEEIVWEQDACSSSALCPFLSGFRSGCDPCSSPHFHPSLSREHLGCHANGQPQNCSGIAASAGARQPGSCQARRHQDEVSQGWTPGRAAADQSLALSLLRAPRALPKGQNLGGGPEELGWGWKSRQLKREVLSVWSGKGWYGDYLTCEFSGWMRA